MKSAAWKQTYRSYAAFLTFSCIISTRCFL